MKRVSWVCRLIFVLHLTFGVWAEAYPPNSQRHNWHKILELGTSQGLHFALYFDENPAMPLCENTQEHLNRYGNAYLPFFLDSEDANGKTIGEFIDGWNFKSFLKDPASGLVDFEAIFEATFPGMAQGEVHVLSLVVQQNKVTSVRLDTRKGSVSVSHSILGLSYQIATAFNSPVYNHGLRGPPKKIGQMLQGKLAPQTKYNLGTHLDRDFVDLMGPEAIAELNRGVRQKKYDRIEIKDLTKLPPGISFSDFAKSQLNDLHQEFLASIEPLSQYQRHQSQDVVRVFVEAYTDAKTQKHIATVFSFEVNPMLRHHFKMIKPVTTLLLRGDRVEEVLLGDCRSGLDKLLK